MSPALEKGIAAAKAGNKKDALKYLREALLLDAQNANAWLWMSAMVEDPEKKRHCLKRVLEIEPENQVARKGLAILNQNFPPSGLEASAATQIPSQPAPAAASAVPSQPLATSQSLTSENRYASTPVPSKPVMASTPVSSKPIPASTQVSSRPVSPFTTPEISPDDPALIKTQAIKIEGVQMVPQVSKPAFLPEQETNSETDQNGSAVSQYANTSLVGKREAVRRARDRRWQVIILILLALVIIITFVVIAVFVYPKLMSGKFSGLLPQSVELPTIHFSDFLSGITQPKQTPLPMPPQLGVFLVESGNYIALTPGNGRPPDVDFPTTTDKLPVIIFYDPSIQPQNVKLFTISDGITGSEVIINLDQNQGIITSTVQNPLDNGPYCFVQSTSTLKPAEQRWWCFQ